MRHLGCFSVIRGEDIAVSAVLFGVLIICWILVYLSQTCGWYIWLKIHNCYHSGKCRSCGDMYLPVWYFCSHNVLMKLCHWRYLVFVTSCIIHLNCAALTAVCTDLCTFWIMSWLLDQQVPFQKKLKFTLEQVMKVQMGSRGIALLFR